MSFLLLAEVGIQLKFWYVLKDPYSNGFDNIDILMKIIFILISIKPNLISFIP